MDMKSEIIDMLAQVDQKFANNFINKFRLVIGQMPEEEQIKSLSYFWTMQLGSLSFSTIEEREYLLTDVDGKTWLARFKKYVLPLIIANDLPI